MKVIIECTDKADAYNLCGRIQQYLSTLDKGDYSGRVVEVEE